MPEHHPETIEQLRQSFSYGARNNLNFKFVANLSDDDFGEFLDEMLHAIGETISDGDASLVIETAGYWQEKAYAGRFVNGERFPHRYEDRPIAPMRRPLSDSTLALVTSSGHFVDGHDPTPLGVTDMTQHEAINRVGEFLKEAPTLSAIPFDTDARALKVRHPGYPIAAAAADHQVNLPTHHLRNLERDGAIGALLPNAYSFVGAASQAEMKKHVAADWAKKLRDEGADAVILIPV